MTAVLGSVIIPAHDEEAVIERCLRALFTGLRPGEIEVVVACNGCTDRTADVVRGLGLPVQVVEIAMPSKVAAIRAAEAQVAAFPRLYLDADVVLSGEAVRTVLHGLADGSCEAGRPPLRYDVEGADPLVRAYHRARSRNPVLTEALWGAGVYGLSASGRARIGDWPDVVGDDLYADRCFEVGEIRIMDCEPVAVAVPRTTRDLLNVLTRTYRGKAEAAPPGRAKPTLGRTVRTFARDAVVHPGTVMDASVYAALAVTGRVLRAARSRETSWARDESSRVPVRA